MKKVIYSITKLGKVENTKITGVGYITDEELVIAQISKNSGKAYIRTFDCIKDCHLVTGTKDEYKGAYYEIVEYNQRDIEVNYYIWYKLAE